MEASILESVGAEIIAIVIPVSLCMLLVVLLVHSLTPHGADVSIQSVATLVYTEKATDSNSQKFEGALLNSLVFVAVITLVTFLLVLLYYYRCIKFLKYYMCASAALVLAYMGGAIFVELIQTWSIPLDIVTFSVFVYNFTIVGVLSVFLSSMPIIITQFYLVMIGMLVAFWFTMLPEWTTWVLLVAMALYDLVAVLAPVGPLKLLVELAMSRDEEIPALIYESRPVSVSEHSSNHSSLPSDGQSSSSAAGTSYWRRRTRTRRSHGGSASARENGLPSTELQPWSGSTSGPIHVNRTDTVEVDLAGLSVAGSPDSTAVATQTASGELLLFDHSEQDGTADEETLPLVRHESRLASMAGSTDRIAPREVQGLTREGEASENESDDGIGLSASGAIKLGLGDFVFYSLLVGRAAMYDLTTVYACYLAIIAGLGSTLVLLAVARRALPALPISVCLGVVFYFLTRLLLEPLVIGLSTTLIMF